MELIQVDELGTYVTGRDCVEELEAMGWTTFYRTMVANRVFDKLMLHDALIDWIAIFSTGNDVAGGYICNWMTNTMV